MIPSHNFTRFLTIPLALTLSGCFDSGLNEGSNLVILNGSLLKGTIRQADISIIDSRGRTVWQGTSDNEARFDAEISSGEGEFYTLVARVTQQSSMMCDATECNVPYADTRYQFGEWIPGIELGDIAFRSAWYPDKAADPTQPRAESRQINSLSTLVVDVIEKDLTTGISPSHYRNLTTDGSAVVAAALGVTTAKGTDLLEVPLINIADPKNSGQSDLLSVINAGQAADLGNIELFSQALVEVVANPDNSAAKTVLSEVQTQLLSETKDIVDNPDIGVDNPAVAQDVGESLDNGVDFETLETSIEQLQDTTENPIDRILASSTHLHPAAPPKDGQWWWASLENAPLAQWLELDYGSSFAALEINIGRNKDFGGNNSLIQGSPDGENWTTVIELDGTAQPNDWVDERNVKHQRFFFDDSSAYRYYRFYSQPTSIIRLEYFCVKHSIEDSPDPCPAANAATNIRVSSALLDPRHIADTNNQNGWVSSLASNQDEWLALQYRQAFVATRVSVVVKQTNQGKNPILQGSSDGENWQLLHTLQDESYPGEQLDEQSFRHIELTLDNNQNFAFYRYHAKPSSFVWLAHLSFNQ